MTKSHITLDFDNKTLNLTKSFYNKACKVGRVISTQRKDLKELSKDLISKSGPARLADFSAETMSDTRNTLQL